MAETKTNVKQKVLDKWTLFKTWFLTTTFINNFTSYPRYYATGFATSLIPVLKKLYKDTPEEITDALQVYGEAYYLAEPTTSAAVTAMVVRMEEQRANGADISRQYINAIKTGVMGGLTGFGDTLFTSALRPLAMAIFTPMAIAGNVMGPLGFLLFKTVCRYINGAIWYIACLKAGKSAINDVLSKGSGMLRSAIDGITVLSLFAMGAMACKYVTPAFTLSVTVNETTASLQSVVDSALPGLLPLASIFSIYWMVNKKKMGVIKIVLIFLAISLIGCLVGLFG